MIEYTIEKLYHFNCTKCSKWWSVGDYDITTFVVNCPFCGKQGNPVRNHAGITPPDING